MTSQVIAYDVEGAPIAPGDMVQVINVNSPFVLYGKIGIVGYGDPASKLWAGGIAFEGDSRTYTVAGKYLKRVSDKPNISLSFEDVFNNTEGG